MNSLRTQQILAEIKDLQTRLKNNGYKIGEPYDPDTIPEEHKEWIGRIWYLGRALTDPGIEV